MKFLTIGKAGMNIFALMASVNGQREALAYVFEVDERACALWPHDGAPERTQSTMRIFKRLHVVDGRELVPVLRSDVPVSVLQLLTGSVEDDKVCLDRIAEHLNLVSAGA